MVGVKVKLKLIQCLDSLRVLLRLDLNIRISHIEEVILIFYLAYVYPIIDKMVRF